jgi:hypothetical protein
MACLVLLFASLASFLSEIELEIAKSKKRIDPWVIISHVISVPIQKTRVHRPIPIAIILLGLYLG